MQFCREYGRFSKFVNAIYKTALKIPQIYYKNELYFKLNY